MNFITINVENITVNAFFNNKFSAFYKDILERHQGYYIKIYRHRRLDIFQGYIRRQSAF